MAKLSLNSRWLLPVLLGIMAILATLLTLLSPEQQNMEPLTNPSIYNNAPSGYRAWYLASQKSGIPIMTWERSFNQLNEMVSPSTMLMLEPYTVAKNSIIFGKKEGVLLLKWVEEGNTLVLLDSFKRYGSQFLADILSLKVKPQQRKHPKGHASAPVQTLYANPRQSLITSYVQQKLLTETQLGFQLKDNPQDTPTPQILLENQNHQPLLIRFPYGKGSIILGTTSDLGANRFLHSPPNDNYQFLSNLLVAEKKPIFINEFIHGYEEVGDLMSYYQKQTPLGAVFAQFFLGFIILLWLSFIRWTPKPVEAPESLSTETSSGLQAYIQSLAGIYYRTQASTLAVAPLLAQIETLLRRKFRISLDEEAQLQNLLRSLFADYSNNEDALNSALEALKKAQAVIRRQEKLPQRELLKLVQQLTHIEERLQHYGQRQYAIRQ